MLALGAALPPGAVGRRATVGAVARSWPARVNGRARRPGSPTAILGAKEAPGSEASLEVNLRVETPRPPGMATIPK